MPTGFASASWTPAGAPVQVVCGAPNARTGMMGVFSPAGKLYSGQEDHARQGGDHGGRIERHARLRGRARNFDDHEASSICQRTRRSAPPSPPMPGSTIGDRGQPHAEPPRRRFHPRHRSRSRGRGHRQARGKPIAPVRAGFPCPRRVQLDFAPADAKLCPRFRAASRSRREIRSLARLHAKAAESDRPSPDQRACRHHQLHDVRSRAAAARLRREEGHGRDHGAPRREG